MLFRSVFNVFLQVLDDGRLTDGQGRTVDFRNAIVIMTSNIGSHIIQEHFLDGKTDGTDRLDMEQKVEAELKAHFRPEFLNRIDATVVFRSLTRKDIHKIVDLELDLVRVRLAEHEIELEITEDAMELLAEKGYDPDFGARPPFPARSEEHTSDLQSQ